MNTERIIKDCPFCEGDIGGCCFCDHSGKIYVGEGYFFKTVDQLDYIGVHFIKDNDPGELWPEMYEHFMDDKNVPDYYKPKNNT